MAAMDEESIRMVKMADPIRALKWQIGKIGKMAKPVGAQENGKMLKTGRAENRFGW